MADRFLLVLWLTGRCNLRCRYCYAGGNPAPFDMDFSTAKAAIDSLGDRPLKLQFAGGEPLLNFPLAEKIIDYVNLKGLDVKFQMQTNGTLIDDRIAGRLRDLRISVGVSLDGPPEVNNLTRGKTLEAVSGIRALGRAGLTVGLNAVVTANTVETLPKLVDLAAYLGNVGGIGLDLLRHAGRGMACEAAAPEQLRRALPAMYRRTLELEALTGRRLEIREVELARKRLNLTKRPENYCYAACGRSMVVLPDGSCYPCGSLVEEKFSMGTAFHPTAPIPLGRTEASACGDCRYHNYCPGGCPSRQIRNQNDLDCVLNQTAFALAERE